MGSSSGSLPSGRSYPDTNAVIALLVDQLPTMNMAQMQFATSHYVGTEKQVLSVTQQLRALNKNFLVLHYHLCMWQSGPMTPYICDGMTWCNDYPTVTMNESWFWHDTNNERVIDPDQALLMNVSVAGFQQYWEQSLETQVADGQYDGIMFDSASPSLLQGWVGGSGMNQDLAPRRHGGARHDVRGAREHDVDRRVADVDQKAQWRSRGQGHPAHPERRQLHHRVGHDRLHGDRRRLLRGVREHQRGRERLAGIHELLCSSGFASLDRIMILQNYLSSPTDVATRMYYLGNYLLVKGHHTYLDYFQGGPLEWYPEWGIDLGAPTTPATTDVSTLASGGVYRRDFAKGSVLVNPTSSPVTVTISGNQVVPMGGGAVDSTGATPGTLSMNAVTSVTVGATTAQIVLH